MPLNTVEDVARRVIADSRADENYLLAVDWINERYRQMVRRAKFRHLRKVGALSMPAQIDAGTVTVLRGSKTVTGDVTAVAAWTNYIIGRHIRFKIGWYEITAIDLVAGTLQIAVEFGEDDVTAGGYNLVARYHRLPFEVKQLGTFIHPRRRIPLNLVNLDMLDVLCTERVRVGTIFEYVAEVGEDKESGQRIIEVYPCAKEQEVVGYTYWADPQQLTIDSYIPRYIDLDVLKEGAMINCLRSEAFKLAKDGKLDAAAFYGNWSEKLNTRWDRLLQEAITAERGADDSSAILEFLKTRHGTGSQDVTTAREQIYANWTPLS